MKGEVAMGLFFKSKAQKKQEAMDKDVDRMMSVCTCRSALDIRVDILAALPAFYVRNAENLSAIKNGRYSTIDAIIFSTYVACEQTLHGAAYKYSNFVESSIKKKVKEITYLMIHLKEQMKIKVDFPK